MAKQKALITGISGQDGAYLADLLLRKGYDVVGTYRHNSTLQDWRLKALGIADRITYLPIDLASYDSVLSILQHVKPTEIYNLAAQSFVAHSFDDPIHTGDIDALGVMRLLQAMRHTNENIKFYQASTSEMFGNTGKLLQDEHTDFHPRSPYAVAKLYGHWATINFREAYGAFACTGILFNHESPLRSREFVTRKITSTLALYKHGENVTLELGNLDARRDWGYARDYVDGMWKMMQQAQSDDYVLATGQSHSIKEFAQLAAQTLDIELEWIGEGMHTKALDVAKGRVVIQVNKRFFRPTEVDVTCGDANKAKTQLGWSSSLSFEQLVALMTKEDFARAQNGTLTQIRKTA